MASSELNSRANVARIVFDTSQQITGERVASTLAVRLEHTAVGPRYLDPQGLARAFREVHPDNAKQAIT